MYFFRAAEIRNIRQMTVRKINEMITKVKFHNQQKKKQRSPFDSPTSEQELNSKNVANLIPLQHFRFVNN